MSQDLAPAVEVKLIDLLDALDEDPVTDEERTIVLKRLISQVVYIKKPGEIIRKCRAREPESRKGSRIK